jgi:carboxyl-terminal processing protease
VLEPGYGYVRIAQFQVNTGQDVASAVGKLRKEGELKGLILDLRNNPGGVLQAAVDVADLFLDDGLVVYTEGRIEDGNIRYNAKPGDLIRDLPLIVLVNEGSASASEILAGALQDHHRGIVLGTDSFGKGSVQTVMQISEDKAIKLTTAFYFTPSGRSIQAQGIKPDIYVVPAQATARRPVLARPLEADLKNHIEVRKNGAETETTNATKDSTNAADIASRSFEQFGQDNQLYEALNMLKGITVFGKANEFNPGRLLSRSFEDHANKTLPLGDKPVINSPNISNEKQ